MIPILLRQDAKTKIGWLAEAISCRCTEERNGIYELELQYPMLGTYAADLVIDRYIKAKPNSTGDNQLFHIRKVSKPINGMFTVSCDHVSYALSGYPVPTVSASGNAQVAINAVLTAAKNQLGKDTGFSAATTDITLSSSIALANVSARAALGGVSGSVLDVYGGEYEFDNHTIKLHKSRGQDHGVRISYGRNMTDLKCEIDMDSAYTGIYGYVKNDDVDLKSYVSVTNSSGINAKTLIRDFSSDFSGDEITQAKLDSAVSAYVAKNDINSPSVSMTVSFVDLSQSPEYASFSALEAVNLCDTVKIYHKDLDIDIKAKVIKTTYDVLRERYTSIELGSPRANFADVIRQTVQEAADAKSLAISSKSEITAAYEKAIADATAAITGNSGGYVRLNPSQNPQELLIMDTLDISTAVNIWRFNLSGFGHSSGGYSGPYRTAVTQDGHFVADFIDTGTLTANIIKAGIMQSVNGQFSFNLETGHISASDIDISGGSINLQGASEQSYNTELTSSNASSLGWKSASEYAAEDEHKPYITADWLTPTSYPTTSPYYQAASAWQSCKKGDVFHLTGEGYNRAFGNGARLDVVAWIQVMYKNDAGETAMSSVCATVIPPSFDDTRVTTIDTTGRIYAPGYTPERFRICVATHKKGTQIDQAVTLGWYAFHNLKVTRTTTEGGSFTVTGSNGYIADLSSGVLRLSYKSGNDTQQFFDMANTRCYSSKDDYKWYATMATQDYTLSGKTSAGFKFGSSNEDTRSYIPTDSTDDNSSLQHEWNTTYARIEKDTTYIRRRIHVNEYCYATDPQEYLSFRASGTKAGNDFTTDFGAAITSAGGSYPSFAVRVRDSAGNDHVRADLFAGNTDRAEVQLYDSLGRKYRLTFKQDKIMFWSETLGTKTINFV
jgi:phage minor structural protein